MVSSKPHPTATKHRRHEELEYPPTGKDNWHIWMEHLRNGVPLTVSGCTESMTCAYDFNYFAEALRGQKITVVHILDPDREEERDAYLFFKSIEAGDPEAAFWKIKVGSFIFPHPPSFVHAY